MDVAGQGHAHEVGHHAARRQQPERRRPVADEVAQPADDLLLDERRERTGVPDVDALVGHLGEQLAHDRDRQRRRREVAELARVLGVHLAAGEPVAELVEDRRRSGSGSAARRPGRRRRRRTPPGASSYGAGSPIARCDGLVVQEVEGGLPRSRSPLARSALGRCQSTRRYVEVGRSRSRRVGAMQAAGCRGWRAGRQADHAAVRRRVDGRRCRSGAGHGSGRLRAGRSVVPRPVTDGDRPQRAPGSTATVRDLGVSRTSCFPCDPTLADTAAFCAAYGFDPEDSANTIVVIGKSRSATLRRLRDAGAVSTRREPDGPRSARDAQGVVRPGRGDGRPDRDADGRRDRVRVAGRAARSGWTPG